MQQRKLKQLANIDSSKKYRTVAKSNSNHSHATLNITFYPKTLIIYFVLFYNNTFSFGFVSTYIDGKRGKINVNNQLRVRF